VAEHVDVPLFLERGAHQFDELRGFFRRNGIERGLLRLQIIVNPLVHGSRLQYVALRMQKNAGECQTILFHYADLISWLWPGLWRGPFRVIIQVCCAAVPPHPGPLPRGEGEIDPAFGENRTAVRWTLEYSEIIRFVAGFPLDVATDAGFLIGEKRFTTEDG